MNLIIVVPQLIIATLFMYRESGIWSLIRAGVMKLKGFEEGFGIAYLFGIIALISTCFTGLLLKSVK